MDTPDASFKEPLTLSEVVVWEDVETNWENTNFLWESGRSFSDGGWSRVIAGQRDGSLSVDGFVEGTVGFTKWEDVETVWESATFNWEVDPGVGDLDSTLIDYLINKTKLNFEINVNGTVELSGSCYITGMETIAPNQELSYYNLELKMTSTIN